MRLAAGFVAYNLVLAALGMALLYAAGLVTLRPARLATAAGAALLTGAAVAGVLAGIALTAGLTLHAASDTAVLLVLTAALAVVGRLRGPVREDATGFEPSRAATVVAALVALFVVIQGGLSRHVAPAWDAAHNWYLKAVALGDHASLTGTMLFSDTIFTPSHQTYPLVHPALGGLLFQYIGNDESGRLVSELWILLGATVLAAPFLAGGGRRGWMALIPFAVAAGGAANQDLLRGDADLTMACFLAVGALALGRWLDDGPPGLLVPAVACLGAAANTKNEGLAFALGTAVAAAAVALVVRRRRAPLLVDGGVALAALIAPWLI